MGAFSLFNIEGEHPRSLSAIARRFALWSLVCWVSGAPSFYLAATIKEPHDHDPRAMALAIILFSVLYTAFTSTDAFDRFQRRPGVRLTLYIGYFTRLGASIFFPVAFAIDMIPGMFSVLAAQALFEGNPFALTFFATCVQGAILNVLISIYMLVVFLIVRAVNRGKREPRGFEVIMPPVATPLANAEPTAIPEAQRPR